jgi:hypothetical protein
MPESLHSYIFILQGVSEELMTHEETLISIQKILFEP